MCVSVFHESLTYFCGISGCSFISDAEDGLGRRPRVIVGREADSVTHVA